MPRVASLVLVLALALPASGLADKPEGKGKGKGKGHQESEEGGTGARGSGFAGDQREAARAYFAQSYGRGHCPPGLAKKHNGCLPPGQAKKRYLVGHPLPREIVVEQVPAELSVRIGPAPGGYRYGIVDGDLIKLAVGTALVVDAIEGMVQ